jgi:hypothetical protein
MIILADLGIIAKITLISHAMGNYGTNLEGDVVRVRETLGGTGPFSGARGQQGFPAGNNVGPIHRSDSPSHVNESNFFQLANDFLPHSIYRSCPVFTKQRPSLHITGYFIDFIPRYTCMEVASGPHNRLMLHGEL